MNGTLCLLISWPDGIELGHFRGRTILMYSTKDINDFGKQVKCSAMNNLGNAIEYAKIPG